MRLGLRIRPAARHAWCLTSGCNGPDGITCQSKQRQRAVYPGVKHRVSHYRGPAGETPPDLRVLSLCGVLATSGAATAAFFMPFITFAPDNWLLSQIAFLAVLALLLLGPGLLVVVGQYLTGSRRPIAGAIVGSAGIMLVVTAFLGGVSWGNRVLDASGAKTSASLAACEQTARGLKVVYSYHVGPNVYFVSPLWPSRCDAAVVQYWPRWPRVSRVEP